MVRLCPSPFSHLAGTLMVLMFSVERWGGGGGGDGILPIAIYMFP